MPVGSLPNTGPRTMSAHVDLLNTELASLYERSPQLLGSIAGTNTITAAADPALTAYVNGMSFIIIPAATTTAAATLNVDSVGAISIYRPNGDATISGDLVISIPYRVTYYNSKFYIENSSVGQTPTGGWKHIASYNLSSETSPYEITGLGGYDMISVVCDVVFSADNGPYFQAGSSGGWLTGASDYGWVVQGQRVTSGDARASDPEDGDFADSQIKWFDEGRNVNGSTTTPVLIEVKFSQWSSTANMKAFSGLTTYSDSTGTDITTSHFGGNVKSILALTRLRLATSSGTITGNILVEGRTY